MVYKKYCQKLHFKSKGLQIKNLLNENKRQSYGREQRGECESEA